MVRFGAMRLSVLPLVALTALLAGCAGGASAITTEPAVVAMPVWSNRSFQPTGMPSNSPRARPARMRPRAACASAIARSGVRLMKIDWSR